MERVKRELKEAASEKDRPHRALRILALLTKCLKKFDIEPILVGGAAVEFYTNGGYTTSDIDLIAPHAEELLELMHNLGFERQGRYFIHKPYSILIEFPSSSLSPGEKTIAIEINGEIVKVLSLEDLVIDRLEAAKWGKSKQDALNAAMLLNEGPDLEEVRKKAEIADVADYLKKTLLILRKRKLPSR